MNMELLHYSGRLYCASSCYWCCACFTSASVMLATFIQIFLEDIFYFNLELSAISINYDWNSCSQGLLFSSGLRGLWWRLYGVLTLGSFHICDRGYTGFVKFPPTLVVIPRVGDQFWHVNERWNGKVIF